MRLLVALLLVCVYAYYTYEFLQQSDRILNSAGLPLVVTWIHMITAGGLLAAATAVQALFARSTFGIVFSVIALPIEIGLNFAMIPAGLAIWISYKLLSTGVYVMQWRLMWGRVNDTE